MVFDSDNNDSSLSAGESSSKNVEELIMMAKMTAAIEAKVHGFNELCWDLCVDKPGAKLDQKTAMCLSNCVDRFFDVAKFIQLRYTQSLHINV